MSTHERPLAGRRAIVSGASSGIGKATALALAGAGCDVVALGRRAAIPAEFAQHPTLRYAAIDLGVVAASPALRAAIPTALDGVDILVNAAGHDHGGGVAFAEQAPQQWQDALAVNLAATMALTSLCLPGMLARDRGDVVLIGSITSRRSSPGLAAYTATKHAVHGFAEGLRADCRETGLRIVELIPGVVRTGFATSRYGGDDARATAFYGNFLECLEPDDVARAVLYAVQQPPHVMVNEIVLMPTRERQ